VTHFAYRERSEPTLELEADYVVVGTGAGGAAAAVVLARGGASVAMVEAGAWRDPEDYPSSFYGALRDQFDEWGTTVTRGRALWPVVQARTVGGTTVINSAIVVRTPGDIFRSWEADHGISAAGYDEAMWRHQDRIERELFVETVPEASLGTSNRLAFDAAQKLGFEGHVMERSVRECLGSGQCLQGCRERRKQSTNLNWVPEVLRREGTLLSCAPVAKVIHQRGRTVGVSGCFVHPQTRRKGAKFSLRARRGVVLAASATHTPNILRRSGLGSRALGENFRSHPGAGVIGIYDRPVHMERGATQGMASMAFRDDPGLKLETLALPLELLAARLGGAGSQLTERLEEMKNAAFWIAAVRAENSVGRVKPGPFGSAAVHYTLCAEDVRKLRIGLHTVAKMHFAVGATSVLPGVYGLPYRLGRDEIGVLLDAPLDPRCYTGILSHLFGGAVMGADPDRSVCDPLGAVRGVEGLFVADAAALPSTLGVNPQHTIMANASVLAERLLAKEI
jgi:choline dehydrogenase-like flavoprotein